MPNSFVDSDEYACEMHPNHRVENRLALPPRADDDVVGTPVAIEIRAVALQKKRGFVHPLRVSLAGAFVVLSKQLVAVTMGRENKRGGRGKQ